MDKFMLKLVGNGGIVVICLLWFTQASFLGALVAAVGLTIIAFLFGDQIILRLSNNITATIADAVTAVIYLWIVAAIAGWSLSFGELLVITVLLGLFEYMFHLRLRQDDDNRKAGNRA